MAHNGFLILEDGSFFPGISVGATTHRCGEVLFNTAQSGYQEILTDPSYSQQIIVFTSPHIGNVGVNQKDEESATVHATGAIFRSFSEVPSNWRAETSLKTFFQHHNCVALSEIDTRALTHHLRIHGSQRGCLVGDSTSLEEALSLTKAFPSLNGVDLAQAVTTPFTYEWHETLECIDKEIPQPGAHIVVYDFGVKHTILRYVKTQGVKVTIVPATTPASEVFALQPDGIILSNGPGDPGACSYAIQATQEILDKGIPLFGICLGHQILALASGAKTTKMQFGHHGANHPVECLATGKVFISSQNHGFVVEEESFPSTLKITHRSLFDGTIAGIRHISKPAFGFQGHPEASPGPTELSILFASFMKEVNHA